LKLAIITVKKKEKKILGGRDSDIIDLNYTKGMGMFLFKNQIISSEYS